MTTIDEVLPTAKNFHGRAINQAEAGWEKTLTGMPDDVGFTLSWG